METSMCLSRTRQTWFWTLPATLLPRGNPELFGSLRHRLAVWQIPDWTPDHSGPQVSLASGASRAFSISGSSCSIPAGAEAYYLNVTVVPAAGLRYLTVW